MAEGKGKDELRRLKLALEATDKQFEEYNGKLKELSSELYPIQSQDFPTTLLVE